MGWLPALLFQLGLGSRLVDVPEPAPDEPEAEPSTPAVDSLKGSDFPYGWREVKLRTTVIARRIEVKFPVPDIEIYATIQNPPDWAAIARQEDEEFPAVLAQLAAAGVIAI